jgi:hypothetical protein
MKSEGNPLPPAIPTLPMKEQVESEVEKLDEGSPRRSVMVGDCLRFESELSPNCVAVDDDDCKATTDYSFASLVGGNGTIARLHYELLYETPPLN